MLHCKDHPTAAKMTVHRIERSRLDASVYDQRPQAQSARDIDGYVRGMLALSINDPRWALTKAGTDLILAKQRA